MELSEQDISGLKITPLGGLGEIGLNMMLFEYGDDLIIVDCGLMFPEPHMLGIDIVIPDISCLLHRKESIRGIFLTHGHEDHIGALPYILRKINPPVYGTALTLGFVSEKLKEFELEGTVKLVGVKPRERVEAGCFSIEFIRVAHSIVDGCAFAIHTPEGVVIHTGDFKIDQTPVDGELTLATFASYGEEGVLALLPIRPMSSGKGTPFRSLVGDAFDNIFPKCPAKDYCRRLFQQYSPGTAGHGAAARSGRKVLLNGRSMIANVRIAGSSATSMPDSLLID